MNASIENVIPVAAHNAVASGLQGAFRSTLKMPKRMNRYFMAKAFDRLILNGENLDDIRTLTSSEKEWLRKVYAEFVAWKSSIKSEKE